MKHLRIALLMNPLKNWDFDGDTSLSIMAECRRRNHSIYHLESKDLLLRGKTLYGNIARCTADEKTGVSIEKRELMNLEKLDCLFIRKEPPFDADYLACTYLLDFLRGKTLVMNDPTGIRSANEKISSLDSPYAPRSAAGYDERLLSDFVKGLKPKDAVLKQTDQKGGQGIEKSSWNDPSLLEKIRRLTNNGKNVIVAQEFIRHEHTGDKRVLILDGKPIGCFTRIPGKNDFRANMSVGAIAKPANLTAQDRKIVSNLKPFLKKHGLYFTGIDILNGKLSEVNVTSPAGIPEINSFDHTHLERLVVNFIEKAA